MVVLGNAKPCPKLAGVIKAVETQSGMSDHMQAMHTDPMRKHTEPRTSVGFIRRVQVMMKPVATPATVIPSEGAASRNPESVAESSLTA